MKASSVADYYMTKYQSKAQQLLSGAMGPITAGLRRFEAEAQAPADVEDAPPGETSMAALARAKLRRMVFSANRSHWFSACELTIFVLTGGRCVQTHWGREVFPGPGTLSHARVPASSEWRDKPDGPNAGFVHRSGRRGGAGAGLACGDGNTQ